jgi:GntR family transcriptional regulator
MSAAAHVPPPDRVVNGPTPKHAQLREILRRTVERELPPGAPIPSERELAQRYGVSRLTVRSAIGKLVEEGLLARVRGKGTFTAARRMELQLYLMSITDDMRRRGLTPTTEVVSAATEDPPTASAHALGLAEGASAHHLVRLRHADGVPLAVERGWYHAGRAPGLLELDLTQSIYAQLAETYGVRPDQAWQTVWAEGADRETARLLGMRAGSPLLVFRRVSSANGDPIEDITSWYRGDHYQVTMQLDRNTPEPGQPPHYGGSR